MGRQGSPGARAHPSPSGGASYARESATSRRVALLDGTTTWSDCIVALTYLVNSRRLVRGAAIERYERAFAKLVGTRHAISFASARIGFYGVLRALGVGRGDEVLLPVPTHIVVANAVRYTGAEPVYVDSEPDTYGIDLKLAEQRVSPRTKVLLLQHTFGIPTDIDAALSLARRHGILVVEDCVHALGATYDDRAVGSFGIAGFFSTEETKTISTTMGGMVVTDGDELAERLRSFQQTCAWPSVSLTRRYLAKLVLYHLVTQPRVHGYTRWLYTRLGRRNPLPGPTSEIDRRGGRPPDYEQRLSNAQAALGMRQLRRLDANVAHRRRVAQAYRTQLSEIGLAPPSSPSKAAPALVRYPVWVEDREAVLQAVSPRVGLGTWFTSVLEEADSPEYGSYEAGSCPVAEAIATHLINLPTHQRVTPEDVDSMVSALASAVAGR